MKRCQHAIEDVILALLRAVEVAARVDPEGF